MSEKYTATGAIIELKDTRKVSEKFSVREFVLEIDDGRYPQSVPFQVTGDRCEEMDIYGIGDVLDVEFNLRGRAWTKPDTGEVKYFGSLDVWRMKRVSEGPAQELGAPTNDDEIPF